MKAKKILFLLMILCSTVGAQISSDQQRILKYWYYREKLKTKFIVGIGSGRGESLPASIREEFSNLWPTPQPGGKLRYGDGTIDLAYYILVLGLEYDLLNNNYQNTKSTLTELFYALDAFNRLDYYAEDYYGKSRSLDGFYTRDDVCFDCYSLGQGTGSPTASLQDNLDKLNDQSPGSDITQFDKASYAFGVANDNFEGKVTSSDHNIHLFLALSYIIQRVDQSTPTDLVFMDNLSNYKDEAKAIMRRLMHKMHKPSNLSGFDKWIIRDANGNRIKNGWGGHAWFFAPGYSSACYQLLNYNNPTTLMKTIDSNWGFCVVTYQTMQSQLWYLLTNPDALKYLNLMTMTGPMSIANGSMASFAAKINLYCQSYQSNITYPAVHIPLLNKYLYNMPDLRAKSYYEQLLDEAPCYGPYNYSYACNKVSYPSYNWSATTFTIHPERRGQCDPDFPGEYNGLDYMMLFNLFYLNEGEPIKKYFYNMYDNNMITDFPTSLNYGSTNDPADIISHNSITASNHISSTGDVEYRAGKSIDLTTNFSVDANASFYAHIDDVECIGSGNEFERSAVASIIPVTNKEKVKISNSGILNIAAFPVPFSDNFNISLQMDKPNHALVKLSNIEGKLLKILYDGEIETVDYFMSFPTTNLERGFYLVTVEANGISKSLKLIKSK